MESKKINQLATELTPALSDLTIIGDPTTGISKKITLSQMASLFTGTVEEYANLASFPLVGAADTIYIALDTNIIYRWNTGTSAYVELSPNIVTSLVFNDANGFDGTISLVGSTATLTITTALTQGSVGFIGASGALTQDNSNFFWDNTNKRLGINTNAPTTAIDAFGSGIIGRLNGTSTNNAFLGFASAGSNKWSIGNVQSDHRFRIYNEATTSELVSVLQTGEFGIGIANPTTKLHIDGGASALIANLDANTSVAKSISFRSDNSARINLEVSGTESGSNAGADLFIRRYSDAGALIDTPFYIQRSTGYIGIATTTPNSTFSVNGDIYASNKIYAANGTAANPSLRFFAGASGLYSTTGDDLGISTNGASRLYISSTGAATFSSSVTSADLIVTDTYANDPLIKLATTTSGNVEVQMRTASTTYNAGIGVVTSGYDFSLFTNNSERLRITSGGNTEVRSAGILNVYRSDNTRALQLYTDNNACYIDAWESSSEPLRLRSNGSGGRIEFHTNATERMRIASNGSVGIGTTGNSAYRLFVVSADTGSSNWNTMLQNSAGNVLFRVRNDGLILTGTETNSPYNLPITTGRTAYLYSDGSLGYQSSVRESKTNIESINDTNWILNLNPVSFNKRFRDEEGNYTEEYCQDLDYGLIAEEAELVNSNICFYDESENGKIIRGVSYEKLITPMLKLIQEQQKQIEELKLLINK